MPANHSIEVWKPVVGFEGWYSVSNLGRVRRDRAAQGTNAGAIKKLKLNKYGYAVVNLFTGTYASRKHRTVHSLVTEAFIGPRPPGQQVNHKDGKKSHNDDWNLEYVTPLGNSRHAVEVLGVFRGRIGLRGEAQPGHKLTDAKVRAIRKLARTERCATIAARFNVARSTVESVVACRTWKHVA